MDLVCAVLMLLLVCKTGKPGMCGVPLFEWNIVYTVIIGMRALANLAKIPLMRSSSPSLNLYVISSFIVVDGCFLAWLIYGNVLFYSRANNCNDIQSAKFLYSFTLVLLVVGYVQMLLYALLIIAVPIMVIYVRSQPDNRPGGHLRGEAIPLVIQGLARQQFSEEMFQHDKECPICMVEYQETDQISRLECDPKHYFHNECLVSWVS